MKPKYRIGDILMQYNEYLDMYMYSMIIDIDESQYHFLSLNWDEKSYMPWEWIDEDPKYTKVA